MMQFSNVQEMFKVPSVPKAANGSRKNSSKIKGRKRKYSVTFSQERYTGELVYHQADPEAMKCLIAANMVGCLPIGKNVKNGRGLPIKTIMVPYFKGGKRQLRLRIKEYNQTSQEEETIVEVKNPFTISWIIHRLSEDQFEKLSQIQDNSSGMRSRTSSISSNQGRSRTFSSSEYFPFSEIVQAQIMQWNDFTCSEVKPFVSAMTINKRLDPSMASNDGSRDIKRKLCAALDVLNGVLEKKSFLMGNRCTLADIIVAVDLIPIIDAKLATNWSELAQLQKELSKEHHVYLRKWFTKVLQMPFVRPIRDTMKCFSRHKATDQNKPNGKGDVKANKNQNELPSSKDSAKGRKMKVKTAMEEQRKDELKKKKDRAMKEKEMAKIETAAMKKAAKDENQSAKDEYDSLAKLPPLKILALHDYRQNKEMFSSMIEPLKQALGSNVEITYVNAPNIPLAHNAWDISHNLRGWWFSSNGDSYDRYTTSEYCKGFEASVSKLVSTIQTEGPFDGIMGFSQGAALAGMICLDTIVSKVTVKLSDETNSLSYDRLFPPELDAFKFAILFSGYCSNSSAHQKIYDQVNEIRKLDKGETLEDCMIPTLNVIGKSSRIVRKKDSEKLASLFGKKSAQNFYYGGGHYVPASRLTQKTAYFKFFSKMKRVCYGDVEVAEGIERMALTNQAAQGGNKIDQGNKSQVPKRGEGADHPVIRAIQDA